MSELLEIAQHAKNVRGKVIARHVRNAGYPGVVVLSCGNAAYWLRLHMQGGGVAERYIPGCIPPVVEIGHNGPLTVQQWLTPAEVHSFFPTYFDATSGHLPFPLMLEIGNELKELFPTLDDTVVYKVPTGSGETILCLRLAFPNIQFIAQYDNTERATTYDKDNPLNAAVAALFPFEIIDRRKE